MVQLTTRPLDICTGISSARSRIDLEIPFFLRSPFDQAFCIVLLFTRAGKKLGLCFFLFFDSHHSDLLLYFDPLISFDVFVWLLSLVLVVYAFGLFTFEFCSLTPFSFR